MTHGLLSPEIKRGHSKWFRANLHQRAEASILESDDCSPQRSSHLFDDWRELVVTLEPDMKRLFSHIMRFWLVFLLSSNLLAGQLTPLVFGDGVDACEAGCPCDEDEHAAATTEGGTPASPRAVADDHAHADDASAHDDHEAGCEHEQLAAEGEAASSSCALDCSDCDCELSLWVGLTTTSPILGAGYPIEYRRHLTHRSMLTETSVEIFIPPRRFVA